MTIATLQPFAAGLALLLYIASIACVVAWMLNREDRYKSDGLAAKDDEEQEHGEVK